MTLDIIVGQLFFAVLLPAIAAGFTLLLRTFWGNWITAIAITIGFLVGYAGLSFIIMNPSGGWWPALKWNFSYSFPPTNLKAYLPYVTVLALGLGFLENFWRKNFGVRWIIRLILLEMLLWQLFQNFLKSDPPFFPNPIWNSRDIFINFGLTTFVTVVFWLLLDILTNRYSQLKNSREPAILTSALVIITTASALNIVLGHSLIDGLLTSALAASLGTVMVFSWLFKKWQLSIVAIPVIVLLQGMLWISGKHFADLPTLSLLMLAFAPAVLLIPLGKMRFWQRAILQLLLLSLFVGGAIFYIKMT